MKKAVRSILLLSLVGGGFLAGSWYSRRPAAAHASASAPRILRYRCPMHPQVTSEKPGEAPCCGMRLEPVYADSGPAESAYRLADLPLGAVNISSAHQQRIGVQVGTVEKAAGRQELRLFGRVAADETRVYRMVAGVEGYFRSVSNVTTGSQVKKDEWLATFFSSDARSPMQAFVITLDTLDREKKSNVKNPQSLSLAMENADIAANRLRSLGMSPLQVEEIVRTRVIPPEIRITAPADGFVVERNATRGQRFEKGEEWYRIADLRQVWILADVFENDAQFLRPGVRVEVVLRNQRKTVSAKVAEILPQFDAATRTLKVRLLADNPDFALRPDMFVDVRLPVALPPAIAVPADAVIDSGLKKTIFVERGEGVFEPRQVETGWRFGDRVEITSGLEAGERIVTSGTFLVDSESRMKFAAIEKGHKHSESVKDPVCGMELDPAKAAASSQFQGKTHHFCSQSCKEKFDKDQHQFAGARPGAST